ncbi:LEAF RUST 10 DISEASE-RESISTANCE LOCUS RECEPTOR-LIKE PROTEIN KINASE-like 1.2 isoform X2 [Brassica rapa]|uniref:LEAF RUST 10 DISEASE-RESISTANCE LOCUS RECEPTOR-LIKE PROTEIN KINASE-like 1.2 isoform X2 n=1 Tax=Brassica campestris TaxID=3711 RepID=UPI0004F157C4|nr:LEAF RUST 10 DISEASE-RESISTANCE LOCUS RECEPTOR-LIKE PROTEIN KINASE-like 1.2 isoform X2 [Brassica rapa]XP_048638391.1 LEAF RUST 10 DISEASE-RESISTANCE LOCUS RECEPTOR-LIKE PROTEIN KINASE-like 1.2 isoform X2 [Brassica napus]
MSSISLLLITIVSLPFCFSADEQYEKCLSSPLRCGHGPSVFPNNTTYPFWGTDIGKPSYCGQIPFKLSCEGNQTLTVEIADLTLPVISTKLENKTITVADERLLEGGCPEVWDFNGDERFTLSHNTEKIGLFECSSYDLVTPLSSISCGGRTYYVFLPNVSDHGCPKAGEVPVLKSAKSALHELRKTLMEALEEGFELRYSIEDKVCQGCSISKGVCGSELGSGSFRCLCSDKPHKSSCDDKGGIDWKLKIVISVVAVTVGLAIASIGWFVYHRRKTKSYRTSSTLLPRNKSSEPSSKSSDVEKAEDMLVGVRLFSYEELEEATSNFDPSKELGDGGFGTVYYGKLKDGRSVAVKRLYDNNIKRAEQFRNEVEILTGLRHPNLVSLFGCSSKQSRELLLVYEYVANGTLADHLHGPQANPSLLPWSTRLKIAVETASALKYLHASKIIHRDVKSNNILLDRNFNVKVADFGLSRLFPMDKTHVSTAPQGTPGYVDPDYHLCYQLSKKSDVYSFAVVLMELISSLPAVDITRTRQEINLSNMAVVKIQSHKLHEMVDPSLGFDTDTRVRETVIAVAELAFQCLQSDKDLRPCMSHVMDTLTKIENNGFGSNMDVNKSGPLVVQSPNSVMAKWDSK